MEIWSHLVINSLLFLFRKGKEEGNMEIPENSKFQHFGILLKSVLKELLMLICFSIWGLS